MTRYDMFINKKRKPVEEKSDAVRIVELHDAVTKAYEFQQEEANRSEFEKTMKQIYRNEVKAKVLGYGLCRDDKDTPLIHKLIREIGQMKMKLKSQYSAFV